MAVGLLQELTALPHSARRRRLYDIGVEARGNSELRAHLDAWERGDWEQRLYCVQACSGSADIPRLVRMIDDPSRSIASQALRLLGEHGDDSILATVLPLLTHARRRRLLTRLRASRRFAVIDRFLDTGFSAGSPGIAELLPYGSASAVERHLSAAEERGGIRFWERLARYHPQIAVTAVLAKLAATEQADGLLLRIAQVVVIYAGHRVPDLTVRLLSELSKITTLAHWQVTEVLYRRPNEMAAVVLASEDAACFSLVPVAHKIEQSLLLRVLNERPAALPVQATWFRKLAAAQRAELYHAVGRSWQDPDGLLPLDLLSLLPPQIRIDEAERIAALPIMATRPLFQIEYAACLPWARMRAIADRFLAHPEGESRAQGWAAILTGLRFQRDQAGETLTLIRKRKFEQDPVRLVMLQNLAALPPGIWQDEHLADIAGIVRESLDATDLSPASAMYLTAWIQKLIASYPKWAADQLVIIYSERGNIGGCELESRIHDAQALTLEAAFLDVAGRWGRGNRVGWLVWFALALGKRLRVCQRLLKVLEGLLGNESAHYDTTILSLLRQNLSGSEFASVAEKLIAAHESWVAMGPIFQFLHRHRQDWLEPHLNKSTFRMRGGSRVELIQLLPPNGYHRYTREQQTVLAGTLNGIIRLPTGDQLPKDVWTMLRAMNALVLLPAIDPTRLIALADDRRPVIADAAIRALGRLDAGQGIPTLVAALGDQRARLAIYALRKAMAEMLPQQLMAQLSNVPLAKVTVAKEAVRLIGEFGGAPGFDWLIAFARQDLHRDVRIAIYRALWDHLDRPEAWSVLAEAAQSVDGQTLNGVVRIPADRLSTASRRRLIELLAGLASHSDAIIRLAVLRRFIEMPLPDSEGRLIQTALRALLANSPDEREAAAHVIAANATTDQAALIADAVGQMREQRRPLHEFVSVLTWNAAVDSARRRRLTPLVQLLLERLRIDPLTAGLCLKLAAEIMGADAFEEELRKLLDDGFPISAVAKEAAAAIEALNAPKDRRKLPELESRLATSADAHVRLLALQVLFAQAQDSQRWDADRRERLATYRHDKSPVVAIPATYFFEGDDA